MCFVINRHRSVKVEEVRGLTDKLCHQVEEVRRFHSSILTAPNPDDGESVRPSVSDVTSVPSVLGFELRSKVKSVMTS